MVEDNTDDIKETTPEIEEKEKDQLLNHIAEMKNRFVIKENLRLKNQNITYPENNSFSKLDSNFKKSAAFVRKLRSFTEQQLDSIVKEMNGLNLEKYISEIAAALLETKLKLSDVNAAVSLCSKLHETYPEFSRLLFERWQKNLSFKKDEKILNPSKLRVDLRFFSDLLIIGILPQKDAFPLLRNVLSLLTANDKEEHANSNIILSFCKHGAEDYIGVIPKKIRELSDKFKIEIPLNSIIGIEKQKCIRMMLVDYYMSLCIHMEKEYDELEIVEKENRKILQTKGELSSDRKEKWDSLNSSYQKLHSTVLSYAEILDEPVPELNAKSHKDSFDDIMISYLNNDSDNMLSSCWVDPESQKFYEELPNVKDYMPTSKTCKDVLHADTTDEKLTTDGKESVENKKLADLEKQEDDAAANVHSKADLETFLNHLPNCVNTEMIDNAAVEFLMYYNNKSHRRRLIKILFNVPRTRIDLLPFYCRLVAILNPVMPDVAIELNGMLKADFKYHVQKKDQINIESKIKIVRFIGEMVKFRLLSKSEGLQCLKDLLKDFTHHHIEMACNFLESAGRFLYHNIDTHQSIKIYMEQMMRKKLVTNFDWRYSTMIENAYYYVNPPEIVRHQTRKKSVFEEFISKILFQELRPDEETETKILKLMRKLDWENKTICQYAIACLTRPWKVTYFNIRCLANLLAGLVEYQDFVGTQVVDNVIEDVRHGIESCNIKMNQRRVAVIKYLGELYNYRMVESNDIFKVLFTLISYGVSYDNDLITPLDPPDSTFRLRLVCILLDTCGQYFNHGFSKQRLDYFIVYFKNYYLSKYFNPMYTSQNPFPIEVKYMVHDTLSTLRPNLEIVYDLEAANKEAYELQIGFINKLQTLDLYKSKRQDYVEGQLETISENEEDYEDEEVSDWEQLLSDSEDHSPVSKVKDKKHAPTGTDNLDLEFTDDLDRMISNSMQIRLMEVVKPQQADISIPYNVRQNSKKNYEQLQDVNNEVEVEKDKSLMNFTVLLRKGNKPQCKNVLMPTECDLAKNFKCQEIAARVEMERVKKITLYINDRLEEEDYQDQIGHSQKQLIQTSRDKRQKSKDIKVNTEESYGKKRKAVV